MNPDHPVSAGKATHFLRRLLGQHFLFKFSSFCLLCAALCTALPTFAQTNVLTQHNDIARTGANINETILTPSNVNTNSFGKLFSFPVDGLVYAQPLYMSGVALAAGTGQASSTHNVVFVATEHDSVYAFDADSNLGANAQPLWQITLLDAAHGVPSGVTATTVPNGDLGTTDIVPEIGITSTGVIDPSTNTFYLVGKTKEMSGTTVSYVQRLHALDITTGAEKFGGPVTLQAAVAGLGSGSSSGILNWDPLWENNRTALLLLNGVVYIAFAAHGDNGPWHGWVLAYNASTLNQSGAWCASPNGTGAGIWTSGAGLAADLPDPVGHPFGRIFVPTGNGDFDATPSYNNTMNYGDSIVTLDLTNGSPSVLDDFTPHDQANMEASDSDLASGGILLLPDSVGGGNHILTQVGKTGRIYVLNQDNLGGFSPSNASDPGEAAYVNGVWGIPAYWNASVYVWSTYDNLKSFPINNGTLSSTYSSKSNEYAGEYSPSPSISSNGTASGIVWNLKTDNYSASGREILYAHDAANVANLLYSSEQNIARDNPGNSVKFIVPTIADGKVFVGSQSQLSVFGLLNGATQAATPVMTPGSQSFNSSVQVTITDSSAGATIYYTTDGSQPTTASTAYSGTFTLTSSSTVNAMATGPGLLQSPIATATYTFSSQGPGGAASIDFGSGFTANYMATVGSAKLNGSALVLTDGESFEAAAAWYNIPVNIRTFTTDFSFQITPASAWIADGFTFTIQGDNASAIGPAGGGLGYGPDTPGHTPGIPNSVAIKFDVYSNAGEGSNSSGLYINGASPTTPAVTLGGGVDLHSGDIFQVHMTYDGTTLAMTITDTMNTAQTFTTSWTVDIPGAVGNTATVGFTGGTGGLTATQQILNWTYVHSTPQPTLTAIAVTPANPSAPAGTTVQFHATGTYSDNSVQDITSSVAWVSSNVSVGTINSSGLASAVASGTSTISGASGSVSGSTTLTVTPATLSSINVTPANPASAAGTTLQFHATGTYSDSSVQDITSSVAWASSNTSVATINSSGLASAVASGTSAISAASGSVSGSTTLTATATTSAGGAINYGSGFTSSGLALNGNAAVNGARLRLTDGNAWEASSAWFASPVNVQNFTTDFSFQITPASPWLGDGFTFTIQGNNTSASGPGGGGLGYGPDTPGNPPGIPDSVAIKFDLYDNAGEGPNSTGLYVNGASPTTPAIALGGGVDLHSGDVFQVHMTYDGTTLTITTTDTTNTALTFTTSWTIDIPGTVGGSTALVGFTAGAGGLVATQDILTWTF